MIKFCKPHWVRDKKETHAYKEVYRRVSKCKNYMIQQYYIGRDYYLYIKNNDKDINHYTYEHCFEKLKKAKEYINNQENRHANTYK